MRWIFFTLALVNLLFFAWALVASSKKQAATTAEVASPSASGLQSLRLLTELEPTKVAGLPSEGVSSASEGKSNVDENTLCEMLGPFGDETAATVVVDRLIAIEIGAQLQKLDLPIGERYQVYLPALASKEEALRKLAELQANKIDSYLVLKGEKENSISLGLFRKKEFANRHLSNLSSLGVEASLDVIEDTEMEYWVTLEPGSAQKMSSLTWQNVLAGTKNIEKRQNYCLAVASEDNFH